MKIVVLAGGTSTERTVSITSGTGICKALRPVSYTHLMADPDRQPLMQYPQMEALSE